jgi:hypothetical protein
VIAKEIRKLMHHMRTTRRLSQHLIGNPRVVFNKGVDTKARVHQMLEAVSDPALLNQHRPDFYGSIPVIG